MKLNTYPIICACLLATSALTFSIEEYSPNEKPAVVYWNDLLPRLSQISEDYHLSLPDIMEHYFEEYDGEDYCRCVDAADKLLDARERTCSTQEGSSRDHCMDRAAQEHTERCEACKELSTDKNGSNAGGNTTTHNETHVSVHGSGNNNGNTGKGTPTGKKR